MSTFVQTDRRGLLNTAQIAIITAPHRDSQAIATLVDGEQVKLAFVYDRVEAFIKPVIAAAPGFWMLQYIYIKNDQYRIDRYPIIGWRLYENRAGPILTHFYDNMEADVVLWPDGQVETGLATYENEAEWLKAEAEDMKQEQLHKEAIQLETNKRLKNEAFPSTAK
jgi:hypothetical protein